MKVSILISVFERKYPAANGRSDAVLEHEPEMRMSCAGMSATSARLSWP
jgi:hypothetical protein